jgi:phosphatidate cytidylyltransferase
MNSFAHERLFGYDHAFDHPVALALSIGLIAVVVVAPLIMAALARSSYIDANLRAELFRRYRSWLVIIPLLLIPTMLGAFWVIIGIGLLGLLCYREYARATGLFREKMLSLTLVVGIIALTLAGLDNWYRLFVALTPLTIALIAAIAILADRPHGYIQRVGLAVLGFVLFGTCLGHLGLMANDRNYRPLIILTVLSVELNDVFAFICGKSLGKRKLIPNTSPNKTIAGAIGAVILTTLLVVGIGVFLFPTQMREAYGVSQWRELGYLAGFGLLVSIVGQFGDLMLSSIKRDLGLKDMGQMIPGHGGLLDRFDSLILAAPVAFHYANYFAGVGLDQPVRIFSGS